MIRYNKRKTLFILLLLGLIDYLIVLPIYAFVAEGIRTPVRGPIALALTFFGAICITIAAMIRLRDMYDEAFLKHQKEDQ